MEVSVKPSESRASRIAPILPSIMSDGATVSAPARACATAWRQSCSMVSSFMMRPMPPSPRLSLDTMPSWPWSEYGSSATSVQTFTFMPYFSLISEMSDGIMPFGL